MFPIVYLSRCIPTVRQLLTSGVICQLSEAAGFNGDQDARDFSNIDQLELTLVISKAWGNWGFFRLIRQKCGCLVHAWSRPILYCPSDSAMLRLGINASSVLHLTISSGKTSFPGAVGLKMFAPNFHLAPLMLLPYEDTLLYYAED